MEGIRGQGGVSAKTKLSYRGNNIRMTFVDASILE